MFPCSSNGFRWSFYHLRETEDRKTVIQLYFQDNWRKLRLKVLFIVLRGKEKKTERKREVGEGDGGAETQRKRERERKP